MTLLVLQWMKALKNLEQCSFLHLGGLSCKILLLCRSFLITTKSTIYAFQKRLWNVLFDLLLSGAVFLLRTLQGPSFFLI
uniref:Uncharacterized protein n=1 Tax=Arundo donax TaxID=35708 RepID=A0A0A9BDP9_ARUDO